MRFLNTILGIFIVLFVISGVFTLLGAAFSLTFGIIGAVIGFVWRIASNPVILILIILFLAFRLRKAEA